MDNIMKLSIMIISFFCAVLAWLVYFYELETLTLITAIIITIEVILIEYLLITE